MVSIDCSRQMMGSTTDERVMSCGFTAMSPTEVTEKLGLMRMKDRSWFCHPSNALAGDGLFEGEVFHTCARVVPSGR